LTDRILKATWSIEAQQDLEAWGGIDVEEIVSNVIRDMDREFIYWANMVNVESSAVNWKKEGF
jgi:hypothetical protein